jgi:hypothetical protein
MCRPFHECCRRKFTLTASHSQQSPTERGAKVNAPDCHDNSHILDRTFESSLSAKGVSMRTRMLDSVSGLHASAQLCLIFFVMFDLTELHTSCPNMIASYQIQPLLEGMRLPLCVNDEIDSYMYSILYVLSGLVHATKVAHDPSCQLN